MRKMAIVFISLLSASYVFAGVINISLNFQRSDFYIEKIGQYDLIRFSGGSTSSIPGYPDLPGVSKTLLMPPTSVVTKVIINNEKWMDIGNYNIFPAQRPVPVMIEHSFTAPNSEIYSIDAFYPENQITHYKTGNKSGFALANFGVTPFRYNPVSGQLQLMISAEVEVFYEEGLQEAVFLTENQLEVFREDVISMVENPLDVERFSPFTKKSAFSEYEYVIVCPTGLSAAFEPLIRWKITRGVGAKIVTTAWVVSNYPGSDLMESIRNFVKDCHQNRGMIYLVLAGDYDNLGARLVRVSCSGYTYDLPSDLYFSDVVPYSSDWDANNNNIFGQYIVDSCDFYSDVYVGRLPLNSTSEVQNWVSKVLDYEQSPPSGFITKALFAGAGLWFSVSPPWSYYGNFSCDSIANNELPTAWTKRKMYQNDTLSYPAGFSDSLSKGFHWSYIAAHGASNSISWYYTGWPNIISNTTMQNLTNGDSLFVISSMACEPGWFDGKECVGEYIFNASAGGAIAVMFNARYGWGYPPYLGPSEFMCIRTAEKVFTNNIRNIGRAHALSKDELINWTWGFNDCEHWCINEFNLFGDPETQIYSKQPAVMTVTHADTIHNMSGVLDVLVTSQGQPVSGAVCCLSRPYDTLFWFRGKTGSTGKAAVEYLALTDQPFLLTVYAKDQLYYQDTIYIDTANTCAILTYFDDENDSTGSFGASAPNIFFGMAHRYTPNLLTLYNGWKIKKVYFYLRNGTNSLNDAVVNIYNGAGPVIPGAIIHSKAFTVAGDTGWNCVVYDDTAAIPVNATGDMWFEVGFTHGNGEAPFYGSYLAQCIPTQTDNFRVGTNWSYMSGYGINICWAIKVILINSLSVEVEINEETPQQFIFRSEKTVFSGANALNFDLTEPGEVTLEIFDISGRIVSQVFRGFLIQGRYTIPLESKNLPPGVLFCRISGPEGEKTVKIEKID